MVIFVFSNIKKCIMYSFVNHHSHMKMMIQYCAFFYVFFLLFFCAEALCALSTFSFCSFQAPLLHSHFASNLVVLHSHFKAWNSFFLIHFLLILTFSYYMKFYYTIIWSSLFEKCSLWLCMHFLLQFDSIGTLTLLLFVVKLIAIVMTCVKLLRACTISICVRLIAWSCVLKHSSYFLALFLGYGFFFLQNQTCGIDMINGLHQHFVPLLCDFYHALWIEEYVFLTLVTPTNQIVVIF